MSKIRLPGAAWAIGLTDLARNLLAGLRVALFLPVRAAAFRASAGQYALLVVFNVALWLAATALQTGLEGQLNPTAVSLFLVNVPLVLATALAVAAVYGERALLTLAAIGLSANDAWFMLLGLGIDQIPGDHALRDWLPGLLLAWFWLAKLRAIAVCAGTRRPQFYLGGMLASAMLALSLFVVPRAEVWVPPEEEPPAPPALADERLFHLQGELIERELSALRPSRPALPEIYFIGFAPAGHEDVFRREMRYVKKVFDERYGTHGRSLALVNNDQSLDEYPLATVTNLRRALERVGKLMNPDKDAVFLFISGHGSEDHHLLSYQPPLVLDELSPTALARILQDSGIKWRIVLVSACYSGGFVEPLRDDRTLVMTASAANRASFGCQHGNEFTWFGRAYFHDALRQTRSFTEAFSLARETVGKQEAREGVEPSLPQISLGAEIEPRLKAYFAR